ncbi:hypothetical protein I547_7672 [Mycobacterium kansasii 824]|nr:hypothetical protein I547_7672 [Mycobacterium kansasii 824]
MPPKREVVRCNLTCLMIIGLDRLCLLGKTDDAPSVAC